MMRRVLARLLIGLVLIGSAPVPSSNERDATAPTPDFVAAAEVDAPLLFPPTLTGIPEAQTEVERASTALTPPAIEEVADAEIQALPIESIGALNAPSTNDVTGAPLSLLNAVTDHPVPGIQKAAQARSAREVQEVRPPRAPRADVAQAPDEYASVAARSEEIAAPPAPRLAVRPAVLRFALTDSGVLPAAQSLEVSSDRRAGVRFEVSGQPAWLAVAAGSGRAGLSGTAVRVSVDGRKVTGPLSGLLEVRNLDDASDVRRIPVEIERSGPGHPLRSRDADGRLQRVVRPDGGILDYDYDSRGNLVRVRRPDGSAVTWSYDELGRRIAMTDGRGTTVYRYDAQGRLDALYTPGFEPVRYGYDERNRLATLHLPGGRVVAYEYDGEDRLLSVRSDLGTTRYAYDAATRRLEERILPNGVGTRYGYDRDGRLIEMTHRDAAGGLLLSFSWQLDDQGRPVRVTREASAGAEVTGLSYDAEGRVASVTDSAGRVVTYEYDALGRRARAVETRGSEVRVTDYAYDAVGRLARAGDEVFLYDEAGDLVRRTSPDRNLKYRWDSEGRLIGFRDGRHEVAYTVDGDGRRVGMTVDGREVSLLQDASGWIGGVLAEADAKGDVVRTHVHGFEPIAVEGKGGEGSFYLYDHPLRSAAALVSPSGALAETFVSDPFGAPLAQPDAALPPYLFAGGAYDPITGLIQLDGGEYDPRLAAFLRTMPDHESSPGQPAAWAERTPAGAFSEALVKTFQPNRPLPADPRDQPAAGRTSGQDPPSASAAPLHVSVFQSNELPASSPRTKTRRIALPSPYRLSPEEGSVYRRGALSEVRSLSTVAPRLKLHPEYLPFAKTASGLLPASQTLEIASSDGQALTFTIEEDIPWLSVSAAGGSAPATLTVTVDPSGLAESGSPYVGDLVLTNTGDATDVRKVRARLLVRSTGAAVTLRSFDANGNLRRVIKPDGSVIDYEVDPLGRVTRVRYPDLPAVSYAYDGNGNRVSMTDQRGTTVYQYDRQNRLTGVFTPLGSNFIPVLYGYDKAGRLTSLATPDGRTVLYQYDADGRMTRVTDGADVTTYAYDSVSGLLASQTLPNGITTAYTYDADGRLTAVVHNAPDGSLLMGFHYTLNAVGQRTSVTKQTPSGSELTSYGYDALGRLESVTYPDTKAVSYTYDSLGNRLSMTTVLGGNTTVVNYEYDKDNRLLKAGDEVFQYDASGNMIRRSSPAGTTTYAYDTRNLLTRVETGDRVVTFEYDGDGNRIAKDSNGLRTNFINDDSGELSQVLVEVNASWQVLQSYSYGVQRIGQASGAGARFFLFDAKDVAALADGGAGLREIYQYDSFGSQRTAAGETPILFNGEYFDAETSLIHLRARFYDPELGRFISRDPLGGAPELPTTYNPYSFVGNDPINWVDPTGLKADWNRFGEASWNLFGSVLLTGTGIGMIGGGSVTGVLSGGTSAPVSLPVALAGTKVMELGMLGIAASSAEMISALTGGGSVPGKGNPVAMVSYLGAKAFGQTDQRATEIANDVSLGTSLFGLGAGIKGLVKNGWSWFEGTSAGVDLIDSVRGLWPDSQPTKSFLYDGLSPDLQPDFRLYASNSPFDLGGVSLNKTADLLLSLQDVTGATFDEATGQIILLGKENIALPPLDMDHVAVATQSVYGGQDPGVSIDPPIVNNQMSVRYEGQTRDTRFGDVMFEADRVLKILTLGKDNLTGQAVSSAVPGYKNMLQRRLDAGCSGTPTSIRMWFQPKEVRLVPSTDGKSMVFDAVSMELLYESKIGNQVVSDPQAAAFASHFTQNYAAFANEWPILKKLEQLGKTVAIIKWIKDNRIPVDLSFLDNFPIEFFSTATSTPTVTVQGTKQTGPVTCTVTIQGGVTYQVPNQYLPADPSAGAALGEALAQRPSEGTFKWSYQPSSGAAAFLQASSPVTAVAESLTRSRRDGNVRFQEVDLSDPLPGGGALALLRTYDSFFDKTGPLGPGWSVLPAELRFPLKKERFTFGSTNLALDLFARIWLTERAAGREDAYDLLGIDSSNLPVYRQADAMHLLRQQSNGTFLLTREDGSAATFRADGKPLSLVDRNGNAVALVYDTQNPDRLLRLATVDDRAIDLSYDAQGRLIQASGPGGRQVGYGFNAQGRLATLTDFAGRSRAYGYDSAGRLVSATDAEGRSIFAAGYDDYDRTPSRRLGAAAQYGLDFDLETGESTAVDPLGRTSRRTHERRQLASPSGIRNEVYRPKESEDPLGNRSTMTWADDAFGPRTVTDAQGATTELAWDNRGHLTTVRDPLGEQTERFYDWRDRLVAIRDAEGLATAFGYDDKNNPTTVYHDVSLTLDAEGNLTSFSYDPANVSTFTYDASGNLASAANQLGQQAQVENNGKGQPTRVTSPAGVATALGYDARSRMTSAQTGSRHVTYGYDTADQITSVTTAAGTTSFVRDPQGRVTRLTDALSRSTLFAYDTDGRLTRVEDALSGVAIYAYDALGNLLSAGLPNGTASAWEYDELGRPVAALTGLGPVAPALALTVDFLDFGSAAVGTSRELPLDLYNQGTAPLTVSGITVSAPFSVAFSGPETIPPAGTLRVTVTFTPTDQVSASANLSITSDDPETPQAFVALSGEGARKIAGLQATPAQDGIQLTWTLFSPGSQPFGHFNIYRSLSPISGSVNGLTPLETSLTSASATSFLDKLATPGTSYYYAVTPVFANGDENKDVDPAGPAAYFTTFGPLAADLALATTAQSEVRPAIAYNSTANNYLVVYERQVSASDTDVYGQRVSATGSLLGSAFAIANTSARHERRPRVAYNANSNNFLVVWEYDTSGNGSNYDLRVRPVSAAGAVGTVVTVANLPRQDLTPEISFGTTSREYLVAYEMDGNADGKTDVGLLRLNAAGAVLDAVFLTLRSNSLDVHATKPFLAYNGTLNDFMLAFEVDAANDGSNIEIWETRIKPDLTLVNGILYYVAHGAGHDRNPYLVYDSGHNEYLAAWENDAAGTGANLDVYSTKISATGSTVGAVIGIANQSEIEKNPRAAYNRNLDDFVLVWERGGAAPKIQARRIHFTLSSLQMQSTVDISSGTTNRKRPDIGTSTTNNTFLVIWDEDAGAGNFDVRSRLLGTFTPTLQMSPASLSFSGAATNQTLTITNGNPAGGPLQWTAVPDSPWMTAQPGSGSTQSSVAVDVAVNRTGLAPGTYSGTVHVESNNGNVEVPVTLLVGNTPPDVPSAPRPANGATDQASVSGGMDLTLGWLGGDADGDVVTWDVYLDTASARVNALDPAVRIGQGLTAPSLQPVGLTFLTSYFWRIVASDSRGGTTAGPVWQFTTAAVPPPALLPVVPDPTRETRPVLAWQAIAGAATYHLQLAANAGFLPNLVDATGLTGTSFTPVSPLPEGMIYWRVRSLDAAGRPGAFSAPDTFVIDTTAAGIPVLVPVTPDPMNNPRATLAWVTVTGASSYRVQVGGNDGFIDPVVDATVSTLSYQPASGLPEGPIYWRVASLDEAGNQSAFSGADHFTLDVTPPPAIVGLTAQRQGAAVDLAWETLAGAPADFARFRIYRAEAPFTNVTGITLLDEFLTSVAAVSFQDGTASPGVAYWYAVTAVDTAENENREVMTAHVLANDPPTEPVLVAPAVGAQVLPSGAMTVMLAWSASDPENDPLRFEVYLSTDIEQVTGTPDITARIAENLTAPLFDAPGLAYQNTYHWRVVALDLETDGSVRSATFGPVWSFMIPPIPAPVLTALTPDPSSELRPAFAWQSVPGAAGYQIEIAADPSFGSTLVATEVTETSFTPAADLPEGSLHWRVRAIDAQGLPGAFSAVDDFVLDATAPAVPVLVPVTPDPTSNRRPSLGWGAVADAESYRFQVSSEVGFVSPLIDTTVTGVSYMPTADLPEGRIYWRVSSVDLAGNPSAFSSADDFLVDATAPGVPVLVPVSPDPTSNRRPNLGWGVVAEVSGYRVQMSSDAGFASSLIDTVVSSPLFIPNVDLPEGRIYWRVASADGAGNQSAFSAADDFLVDATAPAVPVLVPVSPDPTGNRRPSLGWGAIADAVSYRVQVSTEAGFAAPLIDTTVPLNMYQPVSDFPEGRIYWRVAGLDSVGNQSAFSAADDFLVDATAPAVPVLVPMTPDPTSNPRPNLGWDVVADAAIYRVQVSTEAAFASPLIDTTVTGGPYVPASDLPEGRIYWRVSSMDLAGNPSAFSALSSFTSDRTAPPAVTGLSADWASVGTLLEWEPFDESVMDVASFRIYRSDAPFTDVAGRTPIATLNDPAATSFADITGVHGVVHHYAVTGVDLANNELRAVSSAATPAPGGDLYTIAPCRVLDTRDPIGPFGGPVLVAHQPRTFVLAGRCGIPATARAIVANITVIDATAGGSVKAYPGGIGAPLVSTINFPAATVRANNGILGLQPDGSGSLVLEALMPEGATVHVVIDVAGYFE